MKSQTAFAERAGRLARICSGAKLDQDFPLLKALVLDEVMFARLRNAVNIYLYVTLDAYYRDRKFDLGSDLIETERGAIAGLPNITPNGLVLPKRQTYAAYNLVHQGRRAGGRHHGVPPRIRRRRQNRHQMDRAIVLPRKAHGPTR